LKRYLIFKLLAINVVVIVVVIAIVWIAIDTLAAGYFVTLMEKYNISPKPAHAMFVGAIHRYLIWASISAVILSLSFGYAMTRRALAPLTGMTAITREISSGNFDARVPVTTADEVGQLAEAFNRMAKSLHKLESLRRTLMIDVAHELRTPLTNMRGYLEALDDGVLPPSDKIFSLLHDETLRLVQLVEDVLQLARADASKGRLQMETTDLGKLVRSVSQSVFSDFFTQKSIAVNFDIPEHPLTIPLDRKRIYRVLRNLAENAAQYAPENSGVDIQVQYDPDTVSVCYENSADNLRKEDLPYLFERFYRGEKSRSRLHGGAGIGLSIVKEIVEAHGGTVGAELTNGKIRIRFELPIKSH
jgi:two-component system, OmpR family, sensor histidine kinase BaeS